MGGLMKIGDRAQVYLADGVWAGPARLTTVEGDEIELVLTTPHPGRPPLALKVPRTSVSGLPVASASEYPKMISALRFQNVIAPWSSVDTIASRADSVTE